MTMLFGACTGTSTLSHLFAYRCMQISAIMYGLGLGFGLGIQLFSVVPGAFVASTVLPELEGCNLLCRLLLLLTPAETTLGYFSSNHAYRRTPERHSTAENPI